MWAHGLDGGFAAVDLGANAMNLVSYLNEETEAMVIVDATQLGREPGEYLIFTPDQVETQKELAGISTHEGDALKVLEMAARPATPSRPSPSWASSRSRWRAGWNCPRVWPNACRSTPRRRSNVWRSCERTVLSGTATPWALGGHGA